MISQVAGCSERVHRRVLGFSIAHELEGLRIYGYYPEIDDGKESFYRWPIAQLNIWTKEDRWACYRFVENLDREFLPIHTDRLMQLLEEVPDPEEDSLSIDVDDNSRFLRIGSQERPGLRRTTSSQGRGLQPDIRMMVQALQQQEKLQREQKAREEKLLAQLEQQREREERREAEQKAREEKLLAQLEQQRLREEKREAEQKALQDKVFALLKKKISGTETVPAFK